MFLICTDDHQNITLNNIFSKLINTGNPKFSFYRNDDYVSYLKDFPLGQVDKGLIKTVLADAAKESTEIRNVTQVKPQ